MVKLGRRQLANRVEWVRALLSGEYKQGNGYLKRPAGNDFAYCCLGIACEIVAPRAQELVLKEDSLSAGYMSDGRASQRFGMSPVDQRTAAIWNDNSRYSLERIADLVAYATKHETSFRDVSSFVVPKGFAVEWLKEFDK